LRYKARRRGRRPITVNSRLIWHCWTSCPENGLSLARWLRDTHPRMGIVMLTSAADSVDRIVGLELGADDYIPKPFELREVLARVRAVLRRSQLPAATVGAPAGASATQSVRFGRCTLDVDARKLWGADGTEVELSASEFDLLALFAPPQSSVIARQIMEQAHQRGWEVFDRSIDLRILRLRRKIEANPANPQILKTVRSVGYVFTPGT
jgi:two-component system phosphate regulon response regulator OmpR